MNSRNRLGKALVGLIALSLVLLASTSAFSLDRYESREGVFGGVTAGGGVGKNVYDEDNETVFTGFEDSRLLGAYFGGIIGGGVNDNVLVGVGTDWWIRTAKEGSQSLKNNHGSIHALGNFFLIEGLYLEAGGGLAYTTFEFVQGDNEPDVHNELGLALKGGVGYEFWLNGNQAMGVHGNYTRHFYNNGNFDTFNFGATFRWY
ncbi:MAG: hypothetical protein ACQEVA_05740 [Myxococcota bacterium]